MGATKRTDPRTESCLFYPKGLVRSVTRTKILHQQRRARFWLCLERLAVLLGQLRPTSPIPMKWYRAVASIALSVPSRDWKRRMVKAGAVWDAGCWSKSASHGQETFWRQRRHQRTRKVLAFQMTTTRMPRTQRKEITLPVGHYCSCWLAVPNLRYGFWEALWPRRHISTPLCRRGDNVYVLLAHRSPHGR